jgi:2,4-dienoyl-CoA reductase (NADPH2)
VNGALGEMDYGITPAEKKKKVMVVGGGPAGMEAARVAALRGHNVTLYEKESKLGGLLPMAALVKGTEIEDLPLLVRYLETQINKLGVKVNLGQEVTLRLIDEVRPDAVILATGGLPTVPDIPGISRGNVISGAELHRKVKRYLKRFGPERLRSLTKLWLPVGKRVVIIGGDIQGVELAEFLVKRGRKVTVLEAGDRLGRAVPSTNRAHLLPWLEQKGVEMLTGVKYEEITDRGLIITDKEGKKRLIEADTIVPALPLTPNTGLYDSLKGRKNLKVHAVGDCREPRLIVDAIGDGWRTVRKV